MNQSCSINPCVFKSAEYTCYYLKNEKLVMKKSFTDKHLADLSGSSWRLGQDHSCSNDIFDYLVIDK